MVNTSARMLRLLSLLQTNRFWPGVALAARLEVSERTLRRDIDRLRDLGYQVAANPGVAGGYQLRPGSAMPPLLLSDEEAVAIVVGLRAAATGVVDGIEETSVQALTKLVKVMPPRLRRRVEALQTYTVPVVVDRGPTIDTFTLTTIAQACRDDERLRFGYTAADGARTTRLVEPHRLVLHGRRWYLVAWDADRRDWRSFRVDRLSDPQITGIEFHPRELPGGDAAALVHGRAARTPPRYQVVVRVSATTTAVEEAVVPWGRVETLDDHSCLLRMEVDSMEWPTLVLASVGADFEVLQPPELRDYLRTVSELFARVGHETREDSAP
ncbi:YafY family protein [Nocardia sp. CNY236]|uniref:helix-turn-helix transcriptional regulator n=1 Tax=Nocardia sp. CNY236 TaxID=1169152 RepID=UPI0004091942|nr:YafY family protein [Nocardia sp. CNY236]